MTASTLNNALTAFLATYLIHSTVMLGLVWALQRWTRSSAVREVLWRTAVVAPLLTALLSLSLGVTPLTGTLRWSPTPAAYARQIGPDAAPAGLNAVTSRSTFVSMPRSEAAAAQTPTSRRPDRSEPVTFREISLRLTAAARAAFPWLPAIWLLVAIALAGRWLAAARHGRRPIAARCPIVAGAALTRLQELAKRSGHAVPRISVCGALPGPATLRSGEICLPAWALALPDEQLNAMLAHEYAHVVRRDPWWLVAILSVKALFWLQPLNRLAQRRLTELAELHADGQATAWTRDARALARCLVACAERLENSPLPALATGFARKGGALSERVHHLLSGSISKGRLSMSRKAIVYVSALGLLLVLPSVAVIVGEASALAESNHLSIHQDGTGASSTTMSYSHDGTSLEFKSHGEVRFAVDDSGIEHMAPGAGFEVKKTAGGVTHRLTAKGTRGGIDYHYYVNGQERPWDDDARAWFVSTLPELMRETAINASARVRYILAHDGQAGVLDEITKIRSDYARRVYVVEDSATGSLAADDYHRLVEEASRIGSDYDLRQALISVYSTQKPRGRSLTWLLQAGAGIGSDYDMRQLLTAVAPHVVQNEAALSAFAVDAKSIDSDFDLRQTLAALVAENPTPQAVALALPLARSIRSDYDKRRILESAAAGAAQDPKIAAEWLEAAATITSSYDLRRTLIELARQSPESAETWISLIEVAQKIGSEHDRATFLQTAATGMPRDPDVRRAFEATMKTLDSDSDYARVLQLSQ